VNALPTAAATTRLPFWSAWPIVLVLILSMVSARVLTPTRFYEPGPVDLAALVPEQFGDWRIVKVALIQQSLTVSESGVADERSFTNPYDQVLMRTYADSRGNVVMLALAYGKRQGQEIRIHRPELCYSAQGARVSGLRLLTPGEVVGRLPSETFTMLGSSPNRLEQVMYWIRLGDKVTKGAFDIRKQVFVQGLRGYIPDGMLVRSSQILRAQSEAGASIATQQRFLNDLVAAVAPAKRHLLLPQASSSSAGAAAPAP